MDRIDHICNLSARSTTLVLKDYALKRSRRERNSVSTIPNQILSQMVKRSWRQWRAQRVERRMWDVNSKDKNENRDSGICLSVNSAKVRFLPTKRSSRALRQCLQRIP
mmetsp:Transcript_62678/g.74202  ORF Transcript_62678/g.74202 Transcript_62678/m.74202 type:complete len:108 (-) Transcript_62678:141-464(-)